MPPAPPARPRAAERLAPKLPEAPLASARIANAMGDRSQAFEMADEALRLDPRLVEALGLKADILRAQGDLDRLLAEREAPARQAGLGMYVDNIATDFYSRLSPLAARPLADLAVRPGPRPPRGRPADPAAFVRNPSLSDPAALAAHRRPAATRMCGRSGRPPLYYDLGDETGIADLTAAWDFDLSPPSLAGNAGVAARGNTARWRR